MSEFFKQYRNILVVAAVTGGSLLAACSDSHNGDASTTSSTVKSTECRSYLDTKAKVQRQYDFYKANAARWQQAVDKIEPMPENMFRIAVRQLAKVGTIDPKPSAIGGTFLDAEVSTELGTYKVEAYYNQPATPNSPPASRDEISQIVPVDIQITQDTNQVYDMYDGQPLNMNSGETFGGGTDGRIDTVGLIDAHPVIVCLHSLQEEMQVVSAETKKEIDILPTAQSEYELVLYTLVNQS